MNISQRVAILTMMPLPLLISWGAVGVTPATGPLRVHPTNPRYFTLRPGSPASQIGFESWDLSAVGPVKDSDNGPYEHYRPNRQMEKVTK